MLTKLMSLLVVAVVVLGGGTALAGHKGGHAGHEQQMAAPSAGPTPADVVKHRACPHCGMDREKFAHSRVLITYADGDSVGVCSIHCAVTELKASKGKSVKTVEVADLNSKKLIDAEKASWVIGGSRRGVMTRVAKWAFAAKGDAEAFVRKNGGRLADYKGMLALAEKE